MSGAVAQYYYTNNRPKELFQHNMPLEFGLLHCFFLQQRVAEDSYPAEHGCSSSHCFLQCMVCGYGEK